MHTPTLTCLNGRFLPVNEAMLPIADRGFRFGDGVFETIRLEQAVPYQWQLHLSRLEAGLQALRITPPSVDWKAIARTLIQKNHACDGFLRLSISRGVGSRGYLPDADIQANWAMEYLPATPPPKAAYRLWLTSITRPALSSLPANYKLAHGIGSTLALLEARDHGCDEALMLSATGEISETSSGNIFWLKGGALFTPALSTNCIAGTTRAAVLRLADVHEIKADRHELLAADALCISNVRLGIWPIAALMPDGKMFDIAHPVIRDLITKIDADRAAYIAAHSKDWV